MRRTSAPSQYVVISYVLLAFLAVGVTIGAAFGIAAFIINFTRTGTCDRVPVCDLVRGLTEPFVHLDILAVASNASVTVASGDAGDYVYGNYSNYRTLCSGTNSIFLVRATPTGSAAIDGDVAHIWLGTLDANNDPITSTFPADGQTHAIVGILNGVGNHLVGLYAYAENGRKEQDKISVYVEACP